MTTQWKVRENQIKKYFLELIFDLLPVDPWPQNSITEAHYPIPHCQGNCKDALKVWLLEIRYWLGVWSNLRVIQLWGLMWLSFLPSTLRQNSVILCPSQILAVHIKFWRTLFVYIFRKFLLFYTSSENLKESNQHLPKQYLIKRD